MNTNSQLFWVEVHRYNYNKIPRLLKLPELRKILTPSLTETLRKLMLFAVKHQPMIDKNRSVYLLPASKVVRIRGRGTPATANRHLNILCAVGLLNKIEQSVWDIDALVSGNYEFFRHTPSGLHPVNAVRIPKWEPEYLQTVEARARILNDHGITAGNISDNKLLAAGLGDLSHGIYPSNDHGVFTKKEKDYQVILGFIDHSIEVCGYCSKSLIYDNLIDEIERDDIQGLLMIFSEDLKERYNYHMPNKEERERFSLENRKYIYTRKGEKEE